MDKRQARLDPQLFAPTKVDTDQWLSLIKAYGGKYAVLTVKHNCGFLLYPSNTTLPDGTRFNYSVAQSGYAGGQADIVADFVASCKRHGIGRVSTSRLPLRLSLTSPATLCRTPASYQDRFASPRLSTSRSTWRSSRNCGLLTTAALRSGLTVGFLSRSRAACGL